VTADAVASPAAPPAPGRRLVAAALVFVPLAYSSLIASIVVHEVLGHGLTSLAVGGRFDGFVIHADGFGYAMTSGYAGHEVAVLAAGNVVSMALGVLLLFTARRLRGREFACIAALVPALLLVEDAGSYAFWGALSARPPSDFGRIVRILSTHEAHVALSVATGVVWVGAVVLVVRELFLWIERMAGSLPTGRALVVLATFAAIDAAGWMLFDWDQVTPGLARWPSVVGAGIDVAVMALMFRFRKSDAPPAAIEPARWRRAIVVSWVASAAFVAVVLAIWHEPPPG
jgi:hypothetical protein